MGVAVSVGVQVAVAVGVVTDWTATQLAHPCNCTAAPVSSPALRSLSKDVLDMTLPLRNNKAKQMGPDIKIYNDFLNYNLLCSELSIVAFNKVAKRLVHGLTAEVAGARC